MSSAQIPDQARLGKPLVSCEVSTFWESFTRQYGGTGRAIYAIIGSQIVFAIFGFLAASSFVVDNLKMKGMLGVLLSASIGIVGFWILMLTIRTVFACLPEPYLILCEYGIAYAVGWSRKPQFIRFADLESIQVGVKPMLGAAQQVVETMSVTSIAAKVPESARAATVKFKFKDGTTRSVQAMLSGFKETDVKVFWNKAGQLFPRITHIR